jgi:hypothetical protein
VVTAGGVTVSKQGNSYRIVFNDAGVLTNTLDFNENDLFPTSSIGIQNARAGTATVRQIYQVAIKQSPVAYTETFINQDASDASISVIKSAAFAGDAKIWRLAVYPYPKDGTMSLSWTDGTSKTTAPFLVSATGDEIQTAMNAVDSSTDWTVKKVGVYSWDISTSKTTIASPSVNDSGIRSFSAKYCELSLNTVEVENLLNGAASATAYLEVETLVDGVRQTLVQTPVTFVNDIIDEADYTIVSRSEVMPVDSVVRYDTAQTLSTAQQLQARQNIGAVGGTVDVDALETQVNSMDSRLSSVEGVTLTADQYAAIDGATNPSATNLFVTSDALSTELTGYSQTNHTHIIADVVGLQAALNDKVSSTHTHTTADITDFSTGVSAIVNTGLAGKANLVHTHSISDVTNLQTTLNGLGTLIDSKAEGIHYHDKSYVNGLLTDLNTIDQRLGSLDTSVFDLQIVQPTTDEKAAMTFASAPSGSNPFLTQSAIGNIPQVDPSVGPNLSNYSTAGFDTAHYTKEIIITVGGNTYAIPARLI